MCQSESLACAEPNLDRYVEKSRFVQNSVAIIHRGKA